VLEIVVLLDHRFHVLLRFHGHLAEVPAGGFDVAGSEVVRGDTALHSVVANEVSERARTALHVC
jgi:hypothetical protein